MRIASAMAVLACWVAPLAGQATVRLTVGATYSSTLARDQIVADRNLYLHTAVAPTIAAGVALATGGGYRVIVEGQYAHASIYLTEDSARANLWGLGTASVVALFDGPLARHVRWQVGGGRIFYQSAQRAGLFADGNPSAWLFAAGASWTHPIGSGLAALATLRYTVHGFVTNSLRASGFQQSQTVNRLALLLGLERQL